MLLGVAQNSASAQEIANSAIRKIRSGGVIEVKEGQQISDAVLDAAARGEIDAVEAARYLGVAIEKGALPPAELVAKMRTLKSQVGFSLAQWSRIARELKRTLQGNQEAASIFDKIMDAPGPYQKLATAFKYVDNFRRASLTSQLRTAARNLMTQGAMSITNVIEDAASGVLGAMGGKIPAKNALTNAGIDLASGFRAMTKSGRLEIDRILENFPLEAGKLLNTPMLDVAYGKYTKIINTANRLQESFFRKAAFDARLRQTMAAVGRDVSDPSKIPFAAVQDAVSHSLEMTFAKSPISGPGKALLYAYKEIPFLTALANPFPRFWLNAMARIYDFSPIPLLRPKTYAMMASKDPRIAFKALNRAAIGTSLVGAGYALDKSGNTGEKWYEVRVDNKTYDARPYAPFAAHLFMGKLLSRLEKDGEAAFADLSLNDWSQALISMRRTDLTGVPMLDMLDRGDMDGFRNSVLNFFGNYFGGFTVPFKTAKDFIGQFSEEERLPRYRKENPFLGPIIDNIPFVSRELPVAYPPLRDKPEQRLDPALQQLTGLNYREKTPVEMEADRLGLKPKDIYPSTKNPRYDRMISKFMGSYLNNILTQIIEHPDYLTADKDQQKEWFMRRVNNLKRIGRKAEFVNLSTREQLVELAKRETVAVKKEMNLMIEAASDE